MILDIISLKETLNDSVYNIVESYIEMSNKLYNLKESTAIDIQTHLDSIQTLNESLSEKDKEISKLNRDKHEYENMINNLNIRLSSIMENKEEYNKHSILIVQPNELEEKDRVI